MQQLSPMQSLIREVPPFGSNGKSKSFIGSVFRLDPPKWCLVWFPFETQKQVANSRKDSGLDRLPCQLAELEIGGSFCAGNLSRVFQRGHAPLKTVDPTKTWEQHLRFAMACLKCCKNTPYTQYPDVGPLLKREVFIMENQVFPKIP